MATYNDPPPLVTGDNVTAAFLETYFRQNQLAMIPSIFTTKGDIGVASGNKAVARFGVGADNTSIIADSSQPNGLKYGKLVNTVGAAKDVANYWGHSISVGTHTITANTFSSQLPNSAKGLLMNISAMWSAANNGYIAKLLKHGFASENGILVRSLVANYSMDNFGLVELDSNGQFDLIVIGASCSVYLEVYGYIL